MQMNCESLVINKMPYEPEECVGLSTEQKQKLTCRVCTSLCFPVYICNICGTLICKSDYLAMKNKAELKGQELDCIICKKTNVIVYLPESNVVYDLFLHVMVECIGCKEKISIIYIQEHKLKCGKLSLLQNGPDTTLSWNPRWKDQEVGDPTFANKNSEVRYETQLQQEIILKYCSRTLHTRKGFVHGVNSCQFIFAEHSLNFKVGVAFSLEKYNYFLEFSPAESIMFNPCINDVLNPDGSFTPPRIGNYVVKITVDMDKGTIVCSSANFNVQRVDERLKSSVSKEIYPAISFNGDTVCTILGYIN